jgi:O-antigen/teichoic acid export membrane protein
MFLRNALAYSSGNVVSQIARVTQEFIVRRLLPPAVLGVWNFVLVVQGFVATFDAGIIDATSRELPILHGARNVDEVVKVRSTAFWSKLGQNILLAFGIIVYAAVSWRKYDRYFLVALGVAALLVIISSVSESFIMFHQSAQSYVPLAKVLVLTSIIYASLLSAGALLGGLGGLMLAGVAAFLVQSALIARSGFRHKLGIRKIWDRGAFKRLIAFGLPFRLVDYPAQLFPLIDVLFVTKFMGLEALAIYATARAIFTQATQIPTMMGNVVIMRLFNLSGGNTSRHQLGQDLMRFLLAQYLITIPLIICGVMGVMTFLVVQLIPRYALSLPVLQTILFSFYFIPQTNLVRNFWVLDKRIRAIGVANVVGLIGMLASYGAAFFLFGINLGSIALATVGGYAVFFLALMFSVGREVWGMQKMLVLCLHVAVSIIWTSSVIHFVGKEPSSPGVLNGLISLSLMLAKSILLLSPLMLYASWKVEALHYLTLRHAR